MKKLLLMLVAGTALCALAMMVQTTNDNTKNIMDQVLAANINSSNDAAANEVLALLPETALVKAKAGASALDLMAAVSSPPNCNINLATVENAQAQVTEITAANDGYVNTGPPAAAIVQVMNVSPPQVVVLALASGQPPNSGVAFLEMRTALHQDGQLKVGVAVRANLVA